MDKFNPYLKYVVLVLLFVFAILFIQINRYVVIPPSTTIPSIIFDKLTFKSYRVYTLDTEGKTIIAGFTEMKMPKR